jgi:hypothetical protein
MLDELCDVIEEHVDGVSLVRELGVSLELAEGGV